MLLFPTFTPRYRSLSGLMAFFAVSFLLFSGVENGLASQTWYYYSLYYTVGNTPRTSSPIVKRVFFDHQVYDDLVKWPFLSQYSRYTESSWSWFVYYLPQYSFFGANKYPWCYSPDGSGSFSVPDDWDSSDLQMIQDSYDSLSFAQQSALTGAPVCGNKGDEKYVYFPHRAIGSYVSPGGVSTFDSDGIPIVSYPDSSGYATGYKPLPDGSYSPVYYTIDGTTVTEISSIPTSDYSSLDYNAETGLYTLDVPDYSAKLDTIISRIDNIDLRVPAPVVTVNPEVNVTVPPPEVTVNPEVTVELPDSISDSLTDIQASLDTVVSNTSITGSVSSAENFSDLEMSSEEQSLVNDLVSWETNIPLIGDAVDFGLTAIMGKIPSVGTEYVWLDYTIGGSSAGSSGRRGPASLSNPLSGYRVLVSLSNYQDLLQATRGTLILFEALYFVVLIFKLIHKALLV